MTAPAEGLIRIELSAGGGRGAVRIESTRPLSISSRFAGRRPAEVANLVPLVFSICRAAQSAACGEALDSALANGPAERSTMTRLLLTLGETAREHALQVLHFWPHCLKAPMPAMASASIKRLLLLDRGLSRSLGAGAPKRATDEDAAANTDLLRLIEELTALLGEAVFGELPAEWLSRRDAGDLAHWARRTETPAQSIIDYVVQGGMADAGAVDIAPLPQMQAQELQEILFGADAAAFVARPEWDGKPRETTSLSRVMDHRLIESVSSRYGHGLLARLVACLVELAQIPGRMRPLAASLAGEDASSPAPSGLRDSGIGLGVAEAARGRLVHAADIAGGLVRRYRILAPTEWNFHPDGAPAHGLAGIALAAPSQREALARLFITAVDPCVGYELSLS